MTGRRPAARGEDLRVLRNRTAAKAKALIDEHGHEGNFVPAETAEGFVASLQKPRRLIIMVKAGDPTDAVIGEFAPSSTRAT